MKATQPTIYTYLCYRDFLSDYYLWRKENSRQYSYRLMAETLGFTSPNFLKLIIDGDRNISRKSLKKIADGLGLTKKETDYFSYLVFFAQAKNGVDKNYYYGLLLGLRANTGISKITPEQYEYFSEWYHPAIRELVSGMKAPLDYFELGAMLGKKLTVPQIKNSVALLIRLELLRLNKDNVYEQVSPLVNTENEIKNFAIRHYHKDVLAVAQSILDYVSPEDRENSHATLKLSRSGFLKIKERIQGFREEILQFAASDQNVNGVYHVNLQLYPITKHGKNE